MDTHELKAVSAGMQQLNENIRDRLILANRSGMPIIAPMYQDKVRVAKFEFVLTIKRVV